MSERTQPEGGLAVEDRPGEDDERRDREAQTTELRPVEEARLRPGLIATMNILSAYTYALNMRRRNDDLLAALRPAQYGGFFEYDVQPELPDMTNLKSSDIADIHLDYPMRLSSENREEYVARLEAWKDKWVDSLVRRHLPEVKTELTEEAVADADESLTDPHQEPRNKLRAHYEGAMQAMLDAGIFTNDDRFAQLRDALRSYDHDRRIQDALEEHLHRLQSRNPGRVALALLVRKGYRVATSWTTVPLALAYSRLASARARNMSPVEVKGWRAIKPIYVGAVALGLIFGFQAARGRLMPFALPDGELPEDADPRRLGSPSAQPSTGGTGAGVESGVPPADQGNTGSGNGGETDGKSEPVAPPEATKPIVITEGMRWDEILDKAGIPYSQKFMAHAWDVIDASGYGYIEGDLDATTVDYRVNKEDGQIPGELIDQLQDRYKEFQMLEGARSYAAS